MNRPTRKVQVGSEKVQLPEQVRIDDGPQAKSFTFHICVASLENIRRGGADTTSKINALCNTLNLPVIGETGQAVFAEHAIQLLWTPSRWEPINFHGVIEDDIGPRSSDCLF